MNRFEQLCSNLCASAMQHDFNSDILLLLTGEQTGAIVQ